MTGDFFALKYSRCYSRCDTDRQKEDWIPAFAGMTERRAEMTEKQDWGYLGFGVRGMRLPRPLGSQ